MEDQRLIAAVRARSAIYDKWDKNHHNRHFLASAWESIGQEVGSDAITCRNRWGTMRDYFVRKYKQAKPPKNGQTAKKIKWHLYDHLSFLIPIYCQKEVLDDQSESNMSNEIYNESGVKQEADDQLGVGDESLMNSDPVSPTGSMSSSEDFMENASVTFKMPEDSNINDNANTNGNAFDSVSHSNSMIATASATPTPTPTNSRKRPAQNRSRSSLGLDVEVIKAIKESEPMDENELFFKSLLPSLSRLDHLQTMEFRLEVQTLLLKYLRAPRPSSSALSQNGELPQDLVEAVTADYNNVAPLYGGNETVDEVEGHSRQHRELYANGASQHDLPLHQVIQPLPDSDSG